MKNLNSILLMTSLAMVSALSGCGEPTVPSLGKQIDRTGRPAINTALNNTFNGDADAANAAKDAYNADGNVAGWQAAYSSDLATSLAILDSADTVCGNQLLASEAGTDGTIPADRYSALAGIFADDRLYMHTDLSNCGYLGLELWIVGGQVGTPGGCGGRMLGDDVIASSYSALVSGESSRIDDTILEDSATHSDTEFPFVAAPGM